MVPERDMVGNLGSSHCLQTIVWLNPLDLFSEWRQPSGGKKSFSQTKRLCLRGKKPTRSPGLIPISRRSVETYNWVAWYSFAAAYLPRKTVLMLELWGIWKYFNYQVSHIYQVNNYSHNFMCFLTELLAIWRLACLLLVFFKSNIIKFSDIFF